MEVKLKDLSESCSLFLWRGWAMCCIRGNYLEIVLITFPANLAVVVAGLCDHLTRTALTMQECDYFYSLIKLRDLVRGCASVANPMWSSLW